MTRLITTTIYDEVLHKIETLDRNNIDNVALFNSRILKATTTFKDSNGGVMKITLINDKSLAIGMEQLDIANLSKEQQMLFCRLMIQKHLLFTAQDIILYRILLNHYINNQVDGVATISLDTIHKEYRGKAFRYEKGKKYDDDTFQAYINTLNKLISTTVIFNFDESNLKVARYYKFNEEYNISSQLLQISKGITGDNIDTTKFSYTLGKIGDYFVNSKQYGQLLPKEIYSLRFNQIDTFNIAIYVARMIVINKRWRKNINIYVSTLLSRIMKYNIKGYSTSLTYMQYLSTLDGVKRNKKIKQIEEQLNYVLTLLKEKNIITDYKYTGKFQYKHIRDEELYITILVGKKSKTK